MNEKPLFNLVKFTPCKNNAFRHGPFELDEESRTVSCKTCGKILDPFFVLEVFSKQDSFVGFEYLRKAKALADLKEKLEAQNRTKCEHCKKLTRISK